MDENKRSSISNASNLEELGEFWDTHDFTEHDTDAPDVSFTIVRAVQIEAELLAALERQARLRGVGLETLVNLWLQCQNAPQPVHTTICIDWLGANRVQPATWQRNTMQRNGKTPQSAASTTQLQAATVQLPPMTLLDGDITTQDVTSAPQRPAPSTQTADTSAQPAAATPRRRLGGLAAGASIGARLVAAQVAIDSVLGDPNLQAILVAAVAGGLLAQQATTDAAQALTKDRDAALAALSHWMRDFRAIARVALADQPLWQG